MGIVPLPGTLLSFLRTCLGLRLSPCGHPWSVALSLTTHSRLALASTQRWTTSALCHMDSLIPGSGVRYPFLSSRSLWQGLRIPPPLHLGLRAFLYWPCQHENNRNGRLLCPVRAPRFSLVRSAPHRPHCERLFVSAGCSTKEILKTSGSRYRYNVLPSSRVCDCLFLPSSSGISPYRSVSSEIFAVVQVLKAGTDAGSLLFRVTTYGTLLISPSSPSY